MLEFNKALVEKVLSVLDERSCLFPQFALVKMNDELNLLGSGGFSSVYEMRNKERPDKSFAMKVVGLQRHTVSSAEFWNTSRIQWILCQESKYIMRILDARELLVYFDESGEITEVKDIKKEAWEEKEECLHLQFVLMEKLDELLEKDRFGKVKLLRNELKKEEEVLKFALEIGQALAASHNNKCLHRDIKIENVFWDDSEKIYKLGDFGIAKWAEEGKAETIVYTDGYGAPEIQRRLYDSYNATADIYSLGITLYVLLNDLKFPGSDGYYSKVEVQYNPDFVFPAPVYASVEMTRVIRKMCSFYASDRYQSMNDVLVDLAMIVTSKESELDNELYDLAEMATETYKESNQEASDKEIPKERPKTRAERKEEQKMVNRYYREDSLKYFGILSILLLLLFKGLQPDTSAMFHWAFYSLPIAVLLEAMFQHLQEFHWTFGAGLLVYFMFSIGTVGVTVPHIIMILCILIGCSVITAAGAISVALWILLEISGKFPYLDSLYKWELGWLLLVAVLLVVNRFFRMQIDWEKTTYVREYLITFIYDKLFLVMILIGILLEVLQKCHIIVIPDMINHMHLIKSGFLSFICMILFYQYDEISQEEERIGE